VSSLSDQDFQFPQHSNTADLARPVQVTANHLRASQDMPCLPHRQGGGIRRQSKEVINKSRRRVAYQQIHSACALEPGDIGQGHLFVRLPIHAMPPHGPFDD
jgi:hypothetical protein